MRLMKEVHGFVANVKTMSMKKKKLQVRYTEDKHGKTLSIADEDLGLQFTVPFNEISEILRDKT